ncbi:MAG: ferritin-like domain-containing protein [Prosthecobacter sp.]|nr:ferritin-like domain-containing protein [Prosthecobacter sp.]
MKLETLHSLYIHELQDLYSAETQIKTALPKLIKGAASDDLKEALQSHLVVTQLQIDRLHDILTRHGEDCEGEKCQGMAGILKEGAKVLDEEGDATLRDLALISACQRVEHYEMAGYGNARTIAERLDEEADSQLLSDTLEEESGADDELTSIATILLSQVEVEHVV